MKSIVDKSTHAGSIESNIKAIPEHHRSTALQIGRIFDAYIASIENFREFAKIRDGKEKGSIISFELNNFATIEIGILDEGDCRVKVKYNNGQAIEELSITGGSGIYSPELGLFFEAQIVGCLKVARSYANMLASEYTRNKEERLKDLKHCRLTNVFASTEGN
jgi:hypothetical protein